MIKDSSEAVGTEQKRPAYFLDDHQRLTGIQSSVQGLLTSEYGFELTRRSSEPGQLEFIVRYGRQTQMSGPVLRLSIGIVNECWENAGKIQVHIYGTGIGFSCGFQYFNTPEEILPAVRITMEREGLIARLKEGVAEI